MKLKLAIQRRKRLAALRKQLNLTPLFEKWHHALQGENIRQLHLVKDLLFVETAEKKLYAFDRKTGVPLWIYTLGVFLDFPPEIYEDNIYLIGLAKLHVLDTRTGKILAKRELNFVPCSPPCIHDQHIYIGGWDNFMYALERKTGYQDWRYRIDGQIWGKPTMLDGVLFFAATDERIYAINAQNGDTNKEWARKGRYKTRAPNVSGVVAQSTPPTIFFGSRDYNLYNLNRITGSLRWKFESGGEINHHPHKISNSIYVVSSRHKKDSVLYVVNSETGDPKWSIDHGVALFFLGKYHDWIIKNDRHVAAVKSTTGKVKNTFRLDEFDFFVTNAQDNNGYMATQDGYIFAVEER